jgi:ATP-dependent Clp protease ATP-binding subunit ClpA
MDGPQLPFDRDLKATFPKAVVEADAIGASEIGTEHMLLAIMAASESDTARTLAGAGLTLDALRAFIASEAG